MGETPRQSGRPTRAAGAARREGSGVSGLVGAGPSIVGVSGAMRARDVSRPAEAHEETAERAVVVRRRPPPPETSRPQPAPPPPDDLVVNPQRRPPLTR